MTYGLKTYVLTKRQEVQLKMLTFLFKPGLEMSTSEGELRFRDLPNQDVDKGAHRAGSQMM